MTDVDGACHLFVLVKLRMATSNIEALIAGLGEEEVRAEMVLALPH
jgi:hypothetical protein